MGGGQDGNSKEVPLDMTLPSAHHSPRTVKRNAREFVIGTVRLSSAKGKLSAAVLMHHHQPTKTPPITSLFVSQRCPPTIPPQNPKSKTKTKRQKNKKNPPNPPAFPISKKNHTLPVRFTTSGTAYAGLRSRSTTVHAALSVRHLTHPAFVAVSTRSREGWGGGWKLSAARRMKGVVRPQARPTRRKPRVQFRIEGEEEDGGGVSVSDMFWRWAWWRWGVHCLIVLRGFVA